MGSSAVLRSLNSKRALCYEFDCLRRCSVNLNANILLLLACKLIDNSGSCPYGRSITDPNSEKMILDHFNVTDRAIYARQPLFSYVQTQLNRKNRDGEAGGCRPSRNITKGSIVWDYRRKMLIECQLDIFCCGSERWENTGYEAGSERLDSRREWVCRHESHGFAWR